jgi:hypothetical protein
MFVLTVTALVSGVLVGLVRQGSLVRLAYLPVRWPWVAGLVWVVQVLLFVSPLSGPLEPYGGVVHMATILLLAALIVVNRSLPGLALIGLGLLLNAAVLTANGGYMPVSDTALIAVGSQASLDAMRDGARIQKTFLMQPDTPLWPLGDLLPLPLVHKIYSVGDVTAGIGAFVLVVGGMTRRVPAPAAPALAHPS